MDSTPLRSTILLLLATFYPGVTYAVLNRFVAGNWTLSQHGLTGVSGMQLAVVSETKAIIFDKVGANPLMTQGHNAWAAEYDLNTDAVRALNPLSNTFCAAGAFLSNGTLLSTGGNPVIFGEEESDISGLDALRLFTPCEDEQCDVVEFPQVRLTSNRWYPTATRLDDGSVIIFGGSFSGMASISSAAISNPTYEFYPPKAINGFNGTQIPSQFLKDTLNANHFPIIFALPDGKLFIAANNASMIFDWRTNTETRLPYFPNGARVTSPFSASAVMLPLTPANNYTPEILICGGSTLNDFDPIGTYSSQSPTHNFCNRMVLNAQGIASGWKVESMGPIGRIMTDALLLPDGRVFLVSGAHTGIAGFGGNVADAIRQSNADNPAFTPLLYTPSAAAGTRISQEGLPTSPIARMYHSAASLTPNGDILLVGSNPNNPDIVTDLEYPTEYRAEWFSPSYLAMPRPTYSGMPDAVDYNAEFVLEVKLPADTKNVTVSLMDLGFSTHAVHMNQRMVELVCHLSSDLTQLTVQLPPSAGVYPPGPAFLYVVTESGVPSFGHKLIIGRGQSPPVDLGAIANMLSQPVTTSVHSGGW